MATFVQENKRAVVMLAVTLGLALVVGLVMLVTGGSSEPEAAPVPKAAPIVTATTEPDVEQTQAAGSFAPNPASTTDPFEPIAGSEESAAPEDTSQKSDKTPDRTAPESTDSKTASGNTGGASAKGSFADPGTMAGSGSGDGSADASPQPVAPQPLGQQEVPEGAVLVKVLTVGPETLTARVNDEKATLYLSVPDTSGVTYVSPLGGGCAWLAMSGKQARVTVCEGETATL